MMYSWKFIPISVTGKRSVFNGPFMTVHVAQGPGWTYGLSN